MYFRTGGRDERKRYQYAYLTVQQYLSIKCQKKSISVFFEERGYKRVAIYGLGELGRCVLNDLSDTKIKVLYVIDQAYNNYPLGVNGIPVINKEMIYEQEDIDVVVVTVLYEFNKIVDSLLEEIELEKILSLSDVVYSL